MNISVFREFLLFFFVFCSRKNIADGGVPAYSKLLTCPLA